MVNSIRDQRIVVIVVIIAIVATGVVAIEEKMIWLLFPVNVDAI